MSTRTMTTLHLSAVAGMMLIALYSVQHVEGRALTRGEMVTSYGGDGTQISASCGVDEDCYVNYRSGACGGRAAVECDYKAEPMNNPFECISINPPDPLWVCLESEQQLDCIKVYQCFLDPVSDECSDEGAVVVLNKKAPLECYDFYDE